MSSRPRIVVVGNGMVGQRLLAMLADRGLPRSCSVTTFCEESRTAYDRVALSSWFDGANEGDLALAEAEWFADQGIRVLLGDRACEIDRARRIVRSAAGEAVPYDHLVLATGSYPFVPPIPGTDRPGVFVYRTLDDLAAIRSWAESPGVRVGTVVGGGLLGLEAANALRLLGLDTHVVEMAPHLMPTQLDQPAAEVLQGHIEALGLSVHTGVTTSSIEGPDRVGGLAFDDGTELPADLVVFSAGIRPRDDLAAGAGLECGARGGIAVDDHLRTTDPAIRAVGECALHRNRIYGLVAPGYRMAEVVVDQLVASVEGRTDPGTRFEGARLDAKLKLLGVDVASFGDTTSGADTHCFVYRDTTAGIHRSLIVDRVTGQLRGGMLVGDASGYAQLALMAAGEIETPDDPAPLVLPAGLAPAAAVGTDALADSAQICNCESVDKAALCSAIDAGIHTLGDLKELTRAGTGCGACVPMVTDLLRSRLATQGIELSRSLCEHFDHTRQELYDLVRVRGYTSFAEVLAVHGNGATDGCEVCKPTIASILASRANGYVLDGEQAALQDTNDHALANLQRDGSYSVVPRVPGGEITPDQLIALGEVARDFGLYTKITGGQRIDLFGARLDDLPAIWARVIDAGMESGHAYGKALRTVKSCVGQTWCRYGVQDSTAMAIALELRYRGLRAPHKIKMAVSGCARECAEAQSKDVGVIASERGWDLYVGGNGGKRPRHADLFATDLDDARLVLLIDRFLMYYVRTADRLERTATWLEKLDGGLDHLRRVIVDDELEICTELEAEMARHAESYECEWAATLSSAERLGRFVTFVNAPGTSDPGIVRMLERGQPRPARRDEIPNESRVEVAGAVRREE